MHHYPHHIGDYRAHTAHLTMTEDGCYRRLLDICYMTERALPADIAAVQRLAGARDKQERAAVETVLREFFELREDGWRQGRVAREVREYQDRASQARRNGSKSGGRPKTETIAETEPRNNRPGFSSDTETDTGSKPSEKLTVNRKPGTENREPEEKRARSAHADGPPADAMPDFLVSGVEGEALKAFNDVAQRVGWPQAQRLTDTRRAALKARLAECGGLEGWQRALEKASASSFLTGKSGRADGHEHWRCDLDFILRQAKFTKILEGGFDDPPGQPKRAREGEIASLIRGGMSLKDQPVEGF